MPRIFSPNIDGASTELEVWDGAKLKVMVEIIGVDNNLTLELAVVLVYTFEVLDISTNSVLSDEENETKTITKDKPARRIPSIKIINFLRWFAKCLDNLVYIPLFRIDLPTFVFKIVWGRRSKRRE